MKAGTARTQGRPGTAADETTQQQAECKNAAVAYGEAWHANDGPQAPHGSTAQLQKGNCANDKWGPHNERGKWRNIGQPKWGNEAVNMEIRVCTEHGKRILKCGPMPNW